MFTNYLNFKVGFYTLESYMQTQIILAHFALIANIKGHLLQIWMEQQLK